MTTLRFGVILALTFILTVALSKEPQYTQDVVLFKSEQFNLRMELLTGCWIYTKQYMEQNQESLNAQFPSIPFQDIEVSLVKKCLKNIKRADSVSKMRATVEPGSVKNEKKYLDLVGDFSKEDISQESNEFEQFLKPFLKKFREDMVQIQKKGFKEELQKRRKRKLFGLIDIGNTNPTLVMGAITLVLVGIVTFVKYRNRVREANLKREVGKEK